MQSKAEKTSGFILEKVSPIFNQKGYAGTSLSDLTEATGLTKGCLYGNFKNKEDLAVQSLTYNVRKVIQPLSDELSNLVSPFEKLLKIAAYYKNYYQRVKDMGGCPVLKVGVDATNNHPALFEKVQSISQKLENQFQAILQDGINQGEFRKEIDPGFYAKIIYSMIEGAILMSFIHHDPQYLIHMSEYLNQIIHNQLKA